MTRHLGALAPAIRLFRRQAGQDRALAILERAILAADPREPRLNPETLQRCLAYLKGQAP